MKVFGRFGDLFRFQPLGREVQTQIVELHLDELTSWETTEGRIITYGPEVVRFILQRGFSPRLGARRLVETLRELVGNAIVENLLAGANGSGRLVVDGNRLRLQS